MLVRAVYLYIRENRDSGYALTWSDWLETHSASVTLRAGEKLEGEGFSSDPLVISDGLEALSSGRATVLAGDTVYFITVP